MMLKTVKASVFLAVLYSTMSHPFCCFASVIITEIMNNPTTVSDLDGEWFELYNSATVAVNLKNWSVLGNSAVETFSITSDLVLPPGAYTVLGVNGNTNLNGNVTLNFIYKGGIGGHQLLNGDPDRIILRNALGVEVDRVEYSSDSNPNGPFPNQEGASMSLRGVSLDNSNGANWCASVSTYNSADRGTPGTANVCRTSTSSVVINEIMNNPSKVSDEVGEWFELYNTANNSVNLLNWSVRGSSPVETFSITSNLTIPPGGFVVLGVNGDRTTNGNVTVNFVYKGGFGGLQLLNSDPDGIILIDASGIEVDRVEYSADSNPNGPFPNQEAVSMALRNTTLDNSIGANWCASGPLYNSADQGTPGIANVCRIQPTAPPVPAPIVPPVFSPFPASAQSTVVINEIMNNPANFSDADGEWFELFNTANNSVNLLNWSVRGSSPVETFSITSNLTIPPGGFVILGTNGNRTINGNVTVDFVYKGGFGGHQLLNGDPDRISLINASGIEVDRVEYSADSNPNGPFPNREGISMSLRNVTLDNNIGANWCASGTLYNSANKGTPGAANVCGIGPIAPPVSVPAAPPVFSPFPASAQSTVVINEIMNNPANFSDADGEWFELFNTANNSVNLLNWSVRGSSPVETFSITSNLTIPPGGFVILGTNGNRTINGNVTVDFVYKGGFGGHQLLNGDPDRISLINASGIEVDRVEYSADSNPNGPFPNREGISMSLRNVTLDNNIGANWCASGTLYNSANKGTPGAANVCGIGPIAPPVPASVAPMTPPAPMVPRTPMAPPVPVISPFLPPTNDGSVCSSPVNQCSGLFLKGTRVSFSLFGLCIDKCHKSPLLSVVLLLGWKCGACP